MLLKALPILMYHSITSMPKGTKMRSLHVNPKRFNLQMKLLKLLGYEDTNLSRIHAPVGLDIGSISPSEIAISIMAQITNVLREGKIEGPR